MTDIFCALERLEQVGPMLGRALADTITGSRLMSMKGLRQSLSKGSEIRILFEFVPRRMAIMLVGGDKASGKSRKAKWSGWYRTAIPEAERPYEGHLKELGGEK